MKLRIKENNVLKPVLIGRTGILIEHKEFVTPTDSWTMYTVELDEPIILMGEPRKTVNLPKECFEEIK